MQGNRHWKKTLDVGQRERVTYRSVLETEVGCGCRGNKIQGWDLYMHNNSSAVSYPVVAAKARGVLGLNPFTGQNYINQRASGRGTRHV